MSMVEELRFKKECYEIKSACIEVKEHLGSGFLEKVYENALRVELRKRNLNVLAQYPIQIEYKNEMIGDFIADLLVENSIILEIKAVKEILPIHEAQLINYLKATNLPLGILINFYSDKNSFQFQIYPNKFYAGTYKNK